MVYAGNGVPTTDGSGAKQGVVTDKGTHELLCEIIEELKKMNFQLMIMTNEDI